MDLTANVLATVMQARAVSVPAGAVLGRGIVPAGQTVDAQIKQFVVPKTWPPLFSNFYVQLYCLYLYNF